MIATYFCNRVNEVQEGICVLELPPDALSGHRERFSGIFRKMKKFYEEAANLQYFKYLVSIPSLPSLAPNFLQVHLFSFSNASIALQFLFLVSNSCGTDCGF